MLHICAVILKADGRVFSSVCCNLAMKVTASFLWLSYLAAVGVQSKIIKSFKSSEIVETQNEPRIFFKQIMDASGLFPIEINVPDTISSMINSMNSMSQAISSYFAGGNQKCNKQECLLATDSTSKVGALHRKRKVAERLERKAKLGNKEASLLDVILLFVLNF